MTRLFFVSLRGILTLCIYVNSSENTLCLFLVPICWADMKNVIRMWPDLICTSRCGILTHCMCGNSSENTLCLFLGPICWADMNTLTRYSLYVTSWHTDTLYLWKLEWKYLLLVSRTDILSWHAECSSDVTRSNLYVTSRHTDTLYLCHLERKYLLLVPRTDMLSWHEECNQLTEGYNSTARKV